MGLYALERVGLEHPLKAEVAAHLRAAAPFTPAQVFGFDPAQPLALKAKPPSDAYTTLTAALNTAFFASKVCLRREAKAFEALRALWRAAFLCLFRTSP